MRLEAMELELLRVVFPVNPDPLLKFSVCVAELAWNTPVRCAPEKAALKTIGLEKVVPLNRNVKSPVAVEDAEIELVMVPPTQFAVLPQS
jgi:hypothetical protein